MKRLPVISLVALLLFCMAEGRRTRSDIERDRRANQQAMAEADRQMAENDRHIAARLDSLNLLRAEISKISNDIDGIDAEIEALEREMASITDSITTAENELSQLRKSYGASLRQQRSNRQRMNSAAMIFAAGSFKQALHKINYLRQADRYRKARGAMLRNRANALKLQRERLEQVRARRNAALASLQLQRNQLSKRETQAAAIVEDLNRRQRELKATIDARRRKAKALDDELNSIIAEEQRQAEEQRKHDEEKKQNENRQKKKRRSKDNNGAAAPVSPAPVAASGFGGAKGRLPYPLDGNHTVVGQFGRTRHSELQYVEVENNGIDIATESGANACAVYEGVVSSVFFMEGYHNIVMVRHGEYLTVYANIDNLAVAKGDKVKAGQRLGHIYSDPSDGRTIMHFELRHEREKLNPLDWLAK